MRDGIKKTHHFRDGSGKEREKRNQPPAFAIQVSRAEPCRCSSMHLRMLRHLCRWNPFSMLLQHRRDEFRPKSLSPSPRQSSAVQKTPGLQLISIIPIEVELEGGWAVVMTTGDGGGEAEGVGVAMMNMVTMTAIPMRTRTPTTIRTARQKAWRRRSASSSSIRRALSRRSASSSISSPRPIKRMAANSTAVLGVAGLGAGGAGATGAGG